MSETRQRPDSLHSYVPAIDDILSPSQRTEPEPAKTAMPDIGLGFVVVSANVLVTAIIIIAMLVDGAQTTRAIVTGSLYFATSTTLYIFIYTGALSDVVTVWQRERTERYRIQAYTQVAEQTITWRLRVEENHALELQANGLPADLPRRLAQLEDRLFAQQLSAEGVQTPSASSSFVAPYDNRSTAAFAQETQPAIDTTASEALAWVRGLYLDTGLPDPAQVQTSGDKTGWLKVRMLGSKRGTGSKEAGLWLLHRKVILRAAGGYRLNVELFPRRESLRALL